MSDKEIEQQVKESSTAEAGTAGLAAEAAGQLGEFIGRRSAPASGSDIIDLVANKIESSIFSSSFKLGDKERNEAITGLGKSLDAMVKGDIPHLRERMKELGLSTKELDEVEKKLTEKVEAAKPFQNAVLKGDTAALQKMVASMDPKQLAEITELVQKHFDKSGMGIELDYTDGKLIVSRSNGDRAVAISKDKLDVIGVNSDGSYDFSRQYRRENAAKELQDMADDSVRNYLHPPRYYKQPYLIDRHPMYNDVPFNNHILYKSTLSNEARHNTSK